MLSSELKACIQGAYRHFLESKGLRPRYGQRLMIAEIAKTLGGIETDEEGQRTSDPAIVAVEAGTGTGKTVAYGLAAIPIAQAAEKRLVISTATVALQEQIVHKDLPDLMQHSGLSFSFTLAKGRGRYLCVSRLDVLLQDSQAQNATAQLFLEEGFRLEVDEKRLELFTQMLEQLSTNRWDGDRDSWPQSIEDGVWSLVTVDHGQCTGRYCPNIQQCPFYKAREGMTKADVIVTNHDMVLADLALGGGAILPNPAETFYVFDEGHHLPDKAINHFAHSARIRATADWMGQSEKQLSRLLAQHAFPGETGRILERLIEQLKEGRTVQQTLLSLCEQLANFRPPESPETQERPSHRFVGGVIPDPLKVIGQELKGHFQRSADNLNRLTDILRQAMNGDISSGINSYQAEQWYPLFGGMLTRAQANTELWGAFVAEDSEQGPPMARWLTQTEHQDLEIHASPILAAETLRRSLWLPAHGAVITSATLTALNRFDRLYQRAGLPSMAASLAVPSPFQHAEAGLLRVPDLQADPRDQVAHSAAIIRELPKLLEEARGALVLFSSRRQMQEVFTGLNEVWRKRVLVQGDLSKQETLNRHKARVDNHEPSVLFGLASFAEGIDLPGAYCEHVVIARIPFAVPDDPVEAALAEWIEARGGNPFMEITVPDASLKLVQACGRLLRSEQDRGTITLLDRRVVTQRYGRVILDSLPPFRREIS
ncbi:ATP-dependent DNA helicase DinG [Azomonas agilis]|uniref:ATP-dependent DNA helicase DinG n=1 Tax=Azomonas agilis TaxID=116849 RepID=A0A562I1I0_9GAMM|nr:ATP-dependent DNA helicase DinG [Azomonas agilis]TWH64891.1 ATP-dependent DNA helicase DinG [Azomonas agilis]